MALTYSPHLSLHLIATQPISPYPICYYMKYQGKAKKALHHLQNLVVGSSLYIFSWEVSQKAYCRNISGIHEALLSMHSGKLCRIWQLFFPTAALRVLLDPTGQRGLKDGQEWRRQTKFGLVHMQSWKERHMRKMGHEMKGKNVAWALGETHMIWHNLNKGTLQTQRYYTWASNWAWHRSKIQK